jgi:hypothetical protein
MGIPLAPDQKPEQMTFPETLEQAQQKRSFLADQFFGEELGHWTHAVNVEWRYNGKFEATLTDMWTHRDAQIYEDGIYRRARGDEAETGPEAVKNLFNLVTVEAKRGAQVVFNLDTEEEKRFTWNPANEKFVRNLG